MKHYAGIGARSTPQNILSLMQQLGTRLEADGWILRSGGARGADTAFERGVLNPANKEIYLPGRSFNNHYSNQQGVIDATQLQAFDDALNSVAQYHPAPDRLSPFARNLMARNAMQVMGADLQTPSKMVVAWTPGGEVVGGTGQALRMAGDLGIVIRNLGNPEVLRNIQRYLSS